MDQIPRINILILDNGSAEETQIAIGRMESEYPFVQSKRFEDNLDYSVAFRRMMQPVMPNPIAGWIWTFGDDDILMNGALSFMLEQLARFDADSNPPAFIHVAEVSRASGRNGCYRGTLLDLCKQFGWIEMTGFITGNITRAARLYNAANSDNWDTFAETAFVHSCALLEELAHSQAAFLDLPIVNTQSKDQTQDVVQQWIAQNIPTRYLYISTAVDKLFRDDILTEKLPDSFFRYLDYHLWDRFLISALNDYTSSRSLWLDDAWPHVLKFANFLANSGTAAQLRTDVQGVRSLTALHSYLSANLNGLAMELDSIGQRHGFVYPSHYGDAIPNPSSE